VAPTNAGQAQPLGSRREGIGRHSDMAAAGGSDESIIRGRVSRPSASRSRCQSQARVWWQLPLSPTRGRVWSQQVSLCYRLPHPLSGRNRDGAGTDPDKPQTSPSPASRAISEEPADGWSCQCSDAQRARRSRRSSVSGCNGKPSRRMTIDDCPAPISSDELRRRVSPRSRSIALRVNRRPGRGTRS
jgi:hypothetical protein